MNKQPTEAQIKELWEWCGLTRSCSPEDDFYHRGIWNDKDGMRIDTPPIDLNNLFKYAVPKLRKKNEYPYLTEIILDPTICDSEVYYCYLRYDSLHDDGCIEREETQGSAEDPALALFWAIREAINNE